MRILFVIDNLGSGGAQRQITTLAILLKKRNYEISFLTYSPGSFFEKKLEEEGIPRYELSSKNILSRMFRVRSYIRSGTYDAVISFMDTPNFLNCFAAIGGHKWKVITSERSCNNFIFLNRKNKIFNWFQRYSDVIVCNSERAKNMWIKYHFSFKNKIKVIYNAVPSIETNNEYITKKNGRTHLLVAASFQQLKNSIGLVKAISLLTNDQKRHLRIDWYGEKNVSKLGCRIYDETLKIIEEKNLSDVIQLHDSTQDIYEKMKKADVVGLFSLYEGLPNVICEAMTIGKPIIMTKVSDYSTFVDQTNGVLCENSDPKSISIGLKEMLRYDYIDLIDKSSVSRKKSQMFSTDIIINKWIDLL